MTIINPDYQKQLNRMHAKGKFRNGHKAYRIVDKFLKDYQPSSVMDFGCGKGALIAGIKERNPEIVSEGYDPGNPEFTTLPDRTFDAVVSTDRLANPTFGDNSQNNIRQRNLDENSHQSRALTCPKKPEGTERRHWD